MGRIYIYYLIYEPYIFPDYYIVELGFENFPESLFKVKVIRMSRRQKRIELYDQTIAQALTVLKEVSEDTTTPRNIRRAAKNAMDALQDSSNTHAVRCANAISLLDEISQDPNMPSYTRTRIWNIVSLLETVKD